MSLGARHEKTGCVVRVVVVAADAGVAIFVVAGTIALNHQPPLRHLHRTEKDRTRSRRKNKPKWTKIPVHGPIERRPTVTTSLEANERNDALCWNASTPSNRNVYSCRHGGIAASLPYQSWNGGEDCVPIAFATEIGFFPLSNLPSKDR